MDGHINRQGSSYRQGLVLGLTMAEIMLLLVFCLLIAMATFLGAEQTKLAETQTKLAETQQLLDKQLASNEPETASIAAPQQNTALIDKLLADAGSDPVAVDKYWHDLVESKTTMSQLAKEGTSLKELREKATAMASLQKAGIDPDKAIRDADIVAAVKRALPDEDRLALTPQSASDFVIRGLAAKGDGGGNHLPPIISLSEEKGYTFRTGSAELLLPFREALMSTTLDKILSLIKQYDVDVIEVVGHTDEQAYSATKVVSPAIDSTMAMSPPTIIARTSNLDRGLTGVLKTGGDIGKLTPVDNAGLGLARAVSVVSVLRQAPQLAGYKMIPLSGGQLINTDETLALNGASGGDIAQRRRIEIRLRKSTPHETAASILQPQLANPRRVVPPRQITPRLSAPPPRPSGFNIFGR
jgi:outer membrane protein OmpA-like peptidoglycan-associated protein